ncbi:folate-binding protein YgfZ [Allorhizobium sp. BGMRC 0089]|uniref:CAF17-like 4Fe-4S cluster assembly/insertion protein YgfZ n=1 Tax=Allorhizobium sonneratiae TaxID=2934936 RepID=UPI00203444C0|nr:folate-binding protein YgfZ [Allorhizobium sonneratiae]MCM2291994.1 folate-binding protein YgfZ [Allorhizobium sonneratiae]
MTKIYLADRAVLTVTGAEAGHFLNNLFTSDIDRMADGVAAPTALLSPQGKIAFACLVSRTAEGYTLELRAEDQEALVKRLTLYKLRAKVTIAPSASHGVTVIFDEPRPDGAMEDLRFAAAGRRVYRLAGHHTDEDGGAPEALYHALRIECGIAEAGADYPSGEAFPHDVLLDANGGVSFTKGCYVGQEVVSRMHHRKTARRRVAIVSSPSDLPVTGTPLTHGGRPLGTLGSVCGKAGLAIVRIDRAGEAMAKDEPIMAADVAVTLTLPDWAKLNFPMPSDDAIPSNAERHDDD